MKMKENNPSYNSIDNIKFYLTFGLITENSWLVASISLQTGGISVEAWAVEMRTLMVLEYSSSFFCLSASWASISLRIVTKNAWKKCPDEDNRCLYGGGSF